MEGGWRGELCQTHSTKRLAIANLQKKSRSGPNALPTDQSDGVTARSLITTWPLRVPNSRMRNKKPLVGGLSPPFHQSAPLRLQRRLVKSLPDAAEPNDVQWPFWPRYG